MMPLLHIYNDSNDDEIYQVLRKYGINSRQKLLSLKWQHLYDNHKYYQSNIITFKMHYKISYVFDNNHLYQ